MFTVGLVIADRDEYVHVMKELGDNAEACDVMGLIGHTAVLSCNGHDIRVRTVCSGIGKVFSAVAATLLAEGCDLLINAGLSGGFGEAKKHDIVVGTTFVEHDFDLTPIGYKKAQKPGQNRPIVAARELNEDIIKKFPFVKAGAFVTGDCFVSSKEQHSFLEKEFNPIACDMESACVGYVAQLYDIPYVSIRMISDGADDGESKSYIETLNCDVADMWAKITFDWIRSL